MIRAEEISIGDWVSVLDYHHCDGSPYTGKVDGIIKKHGAYYLQFSSAFSADIERCEPIPITPEILEKNGFERGEDKDLWAWYSELERVIWIEGSLTKIISVFTDSHFEGWCYDVHDLQHALKLCGISKNIEL